MSRWGFDRDEVLARVELGALLDELSGPATSLGRTARWHCPVPDHHDVHPSVTVRPDRRGIDRWRCWSMGHGGTAIDALYHARGISYREALEELARRAGVAPDQPGVRHVRRPLPPRSPVPLQPAAVRYVEACERVLWEPAGHAVLNYLVDARGLDLDVLRANRVGADPGTSKLRRAGGLPKAGPGAVFPALDAAGRPVYFQTRYLEPGPTRPKYGNPAGRHGDNPRHAWTRPIGAEKQPIVICEGFPDAYTANSAGYTAVAILGTANATTAFAEQLAPRVDGRPVVLALDGDGAGRLAAKNLREGFGACGIMVVEIPLPPGTDFNSWVTTARSLPDLGPNRPDCNLGHARMRPQLAVPGP
jgi:DNA primase